MNYSFRGFSFNKQKNETRKKPIVLDETGGWIVPSSSANPE